MTELLPVVKFKFQFSLLLSCSRHVLDQIFDPLWSATIKFCTFSAQMLAENLVFTFFWSKIWSKTYSFEQEK